MNDLKDYTLAELTDALEHLGLKSYRAKQLFGWLHQQQATAFEHMTSLPASVREQLSAEFIISSFAPCRIARSRDGSRKYVFETSDGYGIESVVIPEQRHLTLCISTQIGCAMGCRFCLYRTRRAGAQSAPRRNR